MQILKNFIRKPPPPKGRNDVFKDKINLVFPKINEIFPNILKSKLVNS